MSPPVRQAAPPKTLRPWRITRPSLLYFGAGHSHSSHPHRREGVSRRREGREDELLHARDRAREGSFRGDPAGGRGQLAQTSGSHPVRGGPSSRSLGLLRGKARHACLPRSPAAGRPSNRLRARYSSRSATSRRAPLASRREFHPTLAVAWRDSRIQAVRRSAAVLRPGRR